MTVSRPAFARLVFALLLAAWTVFVLAPDMLPAADFTVKSVPNVHLADKNSYLTDPDKLVSPEDTAAINRLARQLEEQSGIQMAVVVLSDIGDNEGRMFATDLFQYWGLGQRGKDNGLLVLLLTDPAQRAVIFETGYGLEGVLPDAVTYRLQQRYMIPDLRQGRYSEGLRKGVAAVSQYLLAGDQGRAAMAAPLKDEESQADLAGGSLLALFAILVLLFVFRKNPGALGAILGYLLGGGFRGGGGGGFGGGGGGSWGGGASGGGGSMSRF